MRRPILYFDLPQERRIIVVSDIHGNLPYFQGILHKVGFCDDDLLIIDGDFLEKGENSLELLRLIMKMSSQGNVLALRGNCDGWHEVLDRAGAIDGYALRYMLPRKNALLRQMCRTQGLEVKADTDMRAVKALLTAHFDREMAFLRDLPVIIETRHYTFVHGGVSAHSIEAANPYSVMKNDNFLSQGLSFDKWMIVGHWPVVFYHENITDANPIILRDRKIISIDGGCVLKDDGQLNALIIPHDGSEDFGCAYYDAFPAATALDGQTASKRSYYIRWGDNRVELLESGTEFSRCRHVRTGYVMDILTKYLREENGELSCNDCTDYELPVLPGDTLSIVAVTSRGSLCKKNGVSGWYRGRIHY
ncbi:MAG: metallophosphoesterase [Oscillospiraceae bacterium]